MGAAGLEGRAACRGFRPLQGKQRIIYKKNRLRGEEGSKPEARSLSGGRKKEKNDAYLRLRDRCGEVLSAQHGSAHGAGLETWEWDARRVTQSMTQVIG